MNIFVLDKDPKTAAKYHNDRHVVKMILEGVQMMASPYYTNNGVVQRSQAHDYQHQLIKKYSTFPREKFYGFGYYSHPCTRWVQHSYKNWMWLADLVSGLCTEYEIRYKKVHACKEVLDWFVNNPPKGLNNSWLTEPLTIPANATTLKEFPQFNDWTQAIETYRTYYKTDKKHLAKWKTTIPIWYE